jgi:ubiquinone/menaquinone biosynthesis C-methylase UbiE
MAAAVASPPFASRVHFPAGAEVLDVGCGPGYFWQQAAPGLPDDHPLTLSDLSPGMVQEALTRVRSLGKWQAVCRRVAGAGSLPFQDSSFDIVFAMHVLYHAQDPELAVTEITRVLRPHGIAVISTNSVNNYAEIFRLGSAAFGGPRVDPGAAMFSWESAAPLLDRLFEKVELEASTYTMRVTDAADVVSYLTSLPPGDAANSDQRERLQAMVETALRDGGGVLPVQRSSGYFVAQKRNAVDAR